MAPLTGFATVIDHIEINDKKATPQLRINFTIPLQYLNHTPEKFGDSLEIQFQNVSVNLFSAESALNEQQIINPPRASEAVPIIDARYEQRSAARGVIIIRFTHKVRYTVQPGSDRRHIIISIIPDKPAAEAGGLPGETPVLAKPPLEPDASMEIIPTLPAVPDEQIAAIMEDARQAVATEDYSRAIQLYTKVLQYPDNPYRQDALEFLGVAREHKGQLAHAVKQYERYLALYPDSEGAERVEQRLVGLTTLTDKPRSLAEGGAVGEKASPWEVFGSFSQFYRRDENTTDENGDLLTQSSLANDLDVSARRRTDNYDIQSRFTGTYFYDFLQDGPGNETAVSNAYFDANDLQRGLTARIGRQTRNTGGVLGRFDGLLLGYRLSDTITLNAVGGYPVFSTRDSFNTDKYLYGISADIGTIANAWDFNVFLIEQRVFGVVDRRAIGGEARYFDPTKSILTFLDYDIFYNSVNTFIFLSTWTLPDRTTINATIDYRNSPLISTSNALQGQPFDTIKDLLDQLTLDEIIALAEDRTSKSTTGTLGVTHPFNEKLQVSGDITISNLQGTSASGGVDAIEGTGNEYFYNLQLIGSSLLQPGDINILGFRFSDTSTSNIYTLSADSRFPVTNNFRINPRVRYDYRDNDDNTTQSTILPSIRLDYRWHRLYRFELEAGREWTTRNLQDGTGDFRSYFISVGYRADF